MERMYRLTCTKHKAKANIGVYLVNLIVDILLFTDGVVALVVFGYLAGKKNVPVIIRMEANLQST